MKRYLILLAVSMAVCFTKNGYADPVPNLMVPTGMSYRVLTASGQVFTGMGTLYSLVLPTGAVTSFAVCFNTRGVSATNTTLANFSSFSVLTPNINYSSQPIVTGNGFPTPSPAGMNWMPYGVLASTGLYCDIEVGSALQLGVYFKQ